MKLNGRRIVEAEHMVVHSIDPAGLPELSGPPRPVMLAPVPEEARDSRGRMIAIAKSYYDAVDYNNGRLAPFAETCERRENGILTARNPLWRPGVAPGPDRVFNFLRAMGCEAQLDSQLFAYITAIDNRRVDIVDEETGLVWGMSHFRHAQERKEYPIFNVPGGTTRTIDNDPFDMPAIHIFKIFSGEIRQIEAMGFTTAYNSPSGWER